MDHEAGEPAQADRFQQAHIESWHTTGFALIEDFFTPAELAPVLEDFEALYGAARQNAAAKTALNEKRQDEVGRFSRQQFKHFDQLPFNASPAVNLISLHPQLIKLAATLLGVEKVHCYQSHTWAKFTGEADYDQTFHCDFANHTLVAPGAQVAHRAVNFVIYVTEVTDSLGALHYVTAADRQAVLSETALQPLPEDGQAQLELKARQRSAAAPAGSLLVYGIDALHRGTNLTEPQGHRYTLTASYKAAGNDAVGFHVWQVAPDRPWHQVMHHASPEQLQALGVPLPGDGFWTADTLAHTQARWPEWDMTAYREALAET